MSDSWYRAPFDLPPYVDDLGGVWSFDGQRLDGPEPEPIEWPEGWPPDLHWTLFQIEVGFAFAESYWAKIDAWIEQVVGRGDGPGPKGFLSS